MAAPKGTPAFFSEQAKAAEDKHTSLVRALFENKPDMKLKKSVLIEQLTNGDYSYSKLLSGQSQAWQSDGGFIIDIDGEKIKGVLECKYQKTRENACERMFRYLTIPKFRNEPWRVFVSCYGPGFRKQDGGGATGPVLDMARSAGMTILENPSDEEFNMALETYVKRLCV